MFHPTRGGTRGGQDQFKWEDVKEDKHRENYLGNSLLAPVGRWQKGRDLTWYAKAGDSKDGSSAQEMKRAEIQSIKDAEAEAMAEALGYKTKRKTENNVSESELKSAIKKTNDSPAEEADNQIKDSLAIQGLGFKSRSSGGMEQKSQGSLSQSGQKTTTENFQNVPVVPLIPAPMTRKDIKDREDGRPPRDSSRRHHSSREKRHGGDHSTSKSPSRHRSGRERSRSHERHSRQRERRHGQSKSRSRSRDRHPTEHRDSRRRDSDKDRYHAGSQERSSRQQDRSRHSQRHESARDRRRT